MSEISLCIHDFTKNMKLVTPSKAFLKENGIGICDKYRTAVSLLFVRGLNILPSRLTPVTFPSKINLICDIIVFYFHQIPLDLLQIRVFRFSNTIYNTLQIKILVLSV